MSPAQSRPASLPVWNLHLRWLHWCLAISMIAAFVTHEDAGRTHEVTGYVALAAVTWRVLLGLIGPSHWRFARFLRDARTTVAYAFAVWKRRETRYIGHNPLGGWMVMALLAVSLAAGLTGWLYVTDRFWGMAWLEALHGAFGRALLPLLALHLAGVVFTSVRHRENLVASMLHGRKRPAGPGDMA